VVVEAPLAAAPARLLRGLAGLVVAGVLREQRAAPQHLLALLYATTTELAAQAVARVTQFLATLTLHGSPQAQDWEP
jgi:hypothetical protein